MLCLTVPVRMADVCRPAGHAEREEREERRDEIGSGVHRLRDEAEAVRGETRRELERDECDRNQQNDEGGRRPVTCEARRRQHRAFADGGDRRHASRPPRRPQAREDRDQRADEQRDDDRPRCEDRRSLRQVDPNRNEEAVQALCEQEAEKEPDDGADQTDDQRLEQHRPEHLAP